MSLLVLGKTTTSEQSNSDATPQRIKPREVNLGTFPISASWLEKSEVIKRYQQLPDNVRIQQPNEIIIITATTYVVQGEPTEE